MSHKSFHNPPVVVQTLSHPQKPEKTFYVCDDGVSCMGGTKQRLLNAWIPTIKQEEIVLAGTNLGLAQVALSMTAKLVARQYGAKIVYPEEEAPVAEIWAMAQDYVKEDPVGRILVPIGLKSAPGTDGFNYFHVALKEALANVPPPKRLWLVSGTGFLGNVLHSIWPDTEFLIIIADQSVFGSHEVENRKHQLFYSKQAFDGTAAPVQPPYESIPWYDAKLWQYVLEYGEDGDYIWNVGKLPSVPADGVAD